MSEPQDILRSHRYDGIEEFDNNLPSWWLWLFYITILISVIYVIHYHVIGTGPSSSDEYLLELNPEYVAPEKKSDSFLSSLTYHSPLHDKSGDWTPKKRTEIVESVDPEFNALLVAAMSKADGENLLKLQEAFPEIYQQFVSGGGEMPVKTSKRSVQAAVIEDVAQMTDDVSLAAGKAIYTTNCVSCHGKFGEGNIGPNLTDEFWIHGGSFPQIVHTIRKGVPIKGMIAWEKQMSRDDIIKVSSYLTTFQGTKPSNGKAAQGERYVPETVEAADTEVAG